MPRKQIYDKIILYRKKCIYYRKEKYVFYRRTNKIDQKIQKEETPTIMKFSQLRTVELQACWRKNGCSRNVQGNLLVI